MERRILIPLDGTEEGEAVLSKLETMVLKDVPSQDVEITLLRVIPVVNFNVLNSDPKAQLPYTEEDKIDLHNQASNYLSGVADRLADNGYKVNIVVKTGPAAEEIVRTARETDASLIAMSTRARSGVIRWAIGSTTDKVIRLEGKVPVLAVHAGKEQESSVLPLGSLQSLLKHS